MRVQFMVSVGGERGRSSLAWCTGKQLHWHGISIARRELVCLAPGRRRCKTHFHIHMRGSIKEMQDQARMSVMPIRMMMMIIIMTHR